MEILDSYNQACLLALIKGIVVLFRLLFRLKKPYIFIYLAREQVRFIKFPKVNCIIAPL